MTLSELTAKVEARGYTVPLEGSSARRNLAEYLGLRSTGSGYRQDYTDRHVELIVAWCRVAQLTGDQRGGWPARVRRKAARLLAAAPLGYVYIHNGQARWSPGVPFVAMRAGAAVWPVQ